MNTPPKVLPIEDMLKYVDEGLFQAIESTINKIGVDRLTTSQIEMTLAAFLGTIIGESCPTTFEAKINCKAYHSIMKTLSCAALEAPELEQGDQVN